MQSPANAALILESEKTRGLSAGLGRMADGWAGLGQGPESTGQRGRVKWLVRWGGKGVGGPDAGRQR